MKKLINKIRGLRIWALFLKELRHIKRDRQLIAALIVPPTVQLIIFGFSLNPVVTGLKLGVMDESRTAISRDVISAFTESISFQVAGYYTSPGFEFECPGVEVKSGGCLFRGSRFVGLYSSQFSESVGG